MAAKAFFAGFCYFSFFFSSFIIPLLMTSFFIKQYKFNLINFYVFCLASAKNFLCGFYFIQGEDMTSTLVSLLLSERAGMVPSRGLGSVSGLLHSSVFREAVPLLLPLFCLNLPDRGSFLSIQIIVCLPSISSHSSLFL